MLAWHFGHRNLNNVVSFRQAANPLPATQRGQALGHGLVQGGSVNLNGVTDPVVILNRHATIASPRRPDQVEGSNEPDAAKLARRIAAYAPHHGTFDLRIPGLCASRFSRTNSEYAHDLRLPSLCIVAQGAKTVIVRQEVYEYDPSRMLVFSVALPIAAQITQASHSEPYLALRLDLDPLKISELVLKVYPNGLPPVQERSAVYISPADHCQRREQINELSRTAWGR